MKKPIRYQDELLNPPSAGEGIHRWILRTAHLGRMAGATREQILRDIRSVARSLKFVPDREIWSATDKVFSQSEVADVRGQATPSLTDDGSVS